MVRKDTVELLKECSAGVKMALSAIDEVEPQIQQEAFKKAVEKSRAAHERLGDEAQTLLDASGDTEKEPNAIAKGMSWLKTNAMLAFDPADKTVAKLLVDGCHVGVKSLSRYLNEYEHADAEARELSRRLIAEEQSLGETARRYL